jgi:hypothetical protein
MCFSREIDSEILEIEAPTEHTSVENLAIKPRVELLKVSFDRYEDFPKIDLVDMVSICPNLRGIAVESPYYKKVKQELEYLLRLLGREDVGITANFSNKKLR